MKDLSWCRMFRHHNLAFIVPFLIVLFGLPIPALAQTLDFGSVIFGQASSPQQVPGCCSNQTSQSVNFQIKITNCTINGSPSFCGSFKFDPHTTCGFSLGPFQSCVIWVTFTPQGVSTTTFTAQVIEEDQGITGPIDLVRADLKGTGLPPPPPPPPSFSPCDLNKDGKIDVTDVQLIVNQILGIVPAPLTSDINGDGVVNVLDLQRVINAVLGLGCHTGP